ncbi:hypothetical protein ACGFNV_26135 [Streptomyces sp. NPDC048751]
MRYAKDKRTSQDGNPGNHRCRSIRGGDWLLQRRGRCTDDRI